MCDMGIVEDKIDKVNIPYINIPEHEEIISSNIANPKIIKSSPYQNNNEIYKNDAIYSNESIKIIVRQKLIVGCALCALFMVVEVIAGIFSNSLALFMDASHLLSDVSSFLISIFAIWMSDLPGTNDLSFGYHRAEILGALISIASVWVLTGLLIIEAFKRIRTPINVNSQIMFFTALLGTIINAVLTFVLGIHGHGMNTCNHDHTDHYHHNHINHNHKCEDNDETHNHIEYDSNFNNTCHHKLVKSDSKLQLDFYEKVGNAASLVNCEKSHRQEDVTINVDKTEGNIPQYNCFIDFFDLDFLFNKFLPFLRTILGDHYNQNVNLKAAYIHVIGDLIQNIGLIIAACIIWIKPEWSIVDPLCSLTFSILILLTTMSTLKEAVNILMEGTPKEVDSIDLRKDFLDIPYVSEVHDLHIWSLSLGKPSLACHIVIYSEEEARDVLHQATKICQLKYGILHTTIQIDFSANNSSCDTDAHSKYIPRGSISDINTLYRSQGDITVKKDWNDSSSDKLREIDKNEIPNMENTYIRLFYKNYNTDSNCPTFNNVLSGLKTRIGSEKHFKNASSQQMSNSLKKKIIIPSTKINDNINFIKTHENIRKGSKLDLIIGKLKEKKQINKNNVKQNLTSDKMYPNFEYTPGKSNRIYSKAPSMPSQSYRQNITHEAQKISRHSNGLYIDKFIKEYLWGELKNNANVVLNRLSHLITKFMINSKEYDSLKMNQAIPLNLPSAVWMDKNRYCNLKESVEDKKSNFTRGSDHRKQLNNLVDLNLINRRKQIPVIDNSYKHSTKLPSPPREDKNNNNSILPLMSSIFKKNYWKECSISSRDITLKESSMWQSIWHLYDPDTVKVRLERLREKMYGSGPFSRQIFNQYDVIDISMLTWREAWKTHIELSIFSIENTPHIGQVVIETDDFRLDLPFKINFVRIPIRSPNQIISIWFNSAYSWPYNRASSKFLFSSTINGLGSFPNSSNSTSYSNNKNVDDKECFEVDNLESFLEDPNEILVRTNECLKNCKSIYFASHYNPETDWPTFFKLNIPVEAVIKEKIIEDETIIAPQGIFYDNHENEFSQSEMFTILRNESRNRFKDPKIKFFLAYRYQGIHNLICTGDTFPDHILSVDTLEKLSNTQIKNFDKSLQDIIINKKKKNTSFSPVDSRYFDIKFSKYENIKKINTKLHKRKVYVADYNDDVDLLVSKTLNNFEGILLDYLESNGNSPGILRISKSLYIVHGEELFIRTSTITHEEQFNQGYNIVSSVDYNKFGMKHEHLVVIGEDFSQPLTDFIMKTKRNLIISTTSHHYSSVFDFFNKNYDSALLKKLPMPDLNINTDQIPLAIKSNSSNIVKLSRHALAISENILLMILHHQFSIPKHTLPQLTNANDLKPPLIELDDADSCIPVTFSWDTNFQNVYVNFIDMNNTEDQLPYYLYPFNYHG